MNLECMREADAAALYPGDWERRCRGCYPVFGGVVSPELNERVWTPMCHMHPFVHVLKACHHLSLPTEPWESR